MHADRLLEAALGRHGLQLHDGLRRAGPLPRPDTVPAPIPSADAHGWRLVWPDRPSGPRLAVAARLRDRNGNPRAADGPFVDDRGRFLWCHTLDERPLYIPFLGVPAGRSTLELTVFALGRGPARPVARCEVPLPPAPGLPWDATTWADPLLVLAVALIHADGVVRSSEQHALAGLVERIGLAGEIDLDAVLARPTPARLDTAVRQARERLAGWGTRTLLEHLVRVAVANGCPSPPERAVLLEIAVELGASREAMERLLHGWGGARPEPRVQSLDAAYELLALQPGASRDATKRAWKEQMRLHHPDRVAEGDAEALARATARCAALNAAYELIMEHGSTARPAPPRERDVAETPVPTSDGITEDAPVPRRRLSSWQIGMGFFALALLAFAVGLAVNSHVEVALAAVVGQGGSGR